MKQETGNNTQSNVNTVSIQLKLGGHSFSLDMIPANAYKADAVEISVVTEKCVLVPASLFEPSSAEKYLSINGLACNNDESVVSSNETDGIIAVMALSKATVQTIKDALSDKVVFTSPLLAKHEGRRKDLYIYVCSGVACFNLYRDGKMRFAEAVRICNTDDILYYTTRLSEEFDLSDYSIHVSGDAAKSTCQLLKHYFKKVQCE